MIAIDDGAGATDRASNYVRPFRHALSSRFNQLLWMMRVPFASFRGYNILVGIATTQQPASWGKNMVDRHVLVVGTGPSLDRVGPEFFARFDTIIYINSALNLSEGRENEFFFSTDLGPILNLLEANGSAAFRILGCDRCIFAPVFLDQCAMLTDAGRDLFTILACDSVSWQCQKLNVGSLRLPLIWRYAPQQPDWRQYVPSLMIGRLPIVHHTSALSAVLFAAVQGSMKIGLIGCDFSAGRALAAGDPTTATSATFSGASGEFRQMAACLERFGVSVTNHSWLL